MSVTIEALYAYRNIEARSCNRRCCGTAIITNYMSCVCVCVCVCVCLCVCVSVALVIQHEKRMRGIILSSVVCPTLLYFSTLSQKRHELKKTSIEHKIHVLILSTTSVRKSLVLRIIYRYIIINVYRSLYSCQILMKPEFSRQIL
jgi:hypothetical protein